MTIPRHTTIQRTAEQKKQEVPYNDNSEANGQKMANVWWKLSQQSLTKFTTVRDQQGSALTRYSMAETDHMLESHTNHQSVPKM